MPIARASMPIVTPGLSHDDARLPPREHGRIRRLQPRSECGSAVTLTTKLQASIVCDQLAEYAAHRRVCPDCGELQPLKDRRTRRLQTLFGTVEIEAPRFRVCRCRRSAPRVEVAFSPVSELLTARCTPELERVQAELGARTSFREAARMAVMVSSN